MRGVGASLVLIVLLAGCSGTGDTGETAAPTSTASLTTTQTAAAGEIDASFDIGGHKLHLTCQGSGSPTVVYLHGLSHAPGDASGASAASLPSLISAKHRFCGYDRFHCARNHEIQLQQSVWQMPFPGPFSPLRRRGRRRVWVLTSGVTPDSMTKAMIGVGPTQLGRRPDRQGT